LSFLRLAGRAPSEDFKNTLERFDAACGLIVFQGSVVGKTMESMLYKAQAKDHPPLARIVENRDGIIAVVPTAPFMAEASMTPLQCRSVHDINGHYPPFRIEPLHPKAARLS